MKSDNDSLSLSNIRTLFLLSSLHYILLLKRHIFEIPFFFSTLFHEIVY